MQFACEEVEAARYSYENDGACRETGWAARKRGWYTRDEFIRVRAWTPARSSSKVAANSEEEVHDATNRAFFSEDEGTCMEALLELNGVGVPTASTLLHFAFPDDYPILDVRALESLGVKARTQYPVSFWLGYLRACRELSMGCGVSVRTLDKALWQHSKNAQTPCGWSRSRRVRLAARDGVATERRKSPRNQLEAHAGRGATAAEDGGLREMCGNSYREEGPSHGARRGPSRP